MRMATKFWRRDPLMDSIDLPDGRELASAELATDALEGWERLERLG